MHHSIDHSSHNRLIYVIGRFLLCLTACFMIVSSVLTYHAVIAEEEVPVTEEVTETIVEEDDSVSEEATETVEDEAVPEEFVQEEAISSDDELSNVNEIDVTADNENSTPEEVAFYNDLDVIEEDDDSFSANEENYGIQMVSTSVFQQKSNEFINKHPWMHADQWDGNQGVTLGQSWASWGCRAYASDFAKYVYGALLAGNDSANGGQRFTNINEIRAGDIVYVEPTHYFVVLSRTGNNLYTAEGNASWIKGPVQVSPNRVNIDSDKYVIYNGKIYSKYYSNWQNNANAISTFQCGWHYVDSTAYNSITTRPVLWAPGCRYSSSVPASLSLPGRNSLLHISPMRSQPFLNGHIAKWI